MPEEFSLDYPENTPDQQDTTGMDVDEKVDDDDDDSKSEGFLFYLQQQGHYSEGPTIIMDEQPLLIPETRIISVRVSWPDEMLKRYDTSILSNLPETGGIALITKTPPESVSLYKCLEAFLKEEPLGPEDMW